MSFSRRKFLKGLSVTGAIAGAAIPLYYGQRELRREYNEYIDRQLGVTPGEAIAEPANTDQATLANYLRGIWTINFTRAGEEFEKLTGNTMEMLLDAGATGRAIRGYLGSPERLRSDDNPEYQILGDMAAQNIKEIRWRLIDPDSKSHQPIYEFIAALDEAWGYWGDAGINTLSGRVRRLDRPLHLPKQELEFVARKHRFPEARERIQFTKPMQDWLTSPSHRLFHQLWHASRDKWDKLSEDKRTALRGLGWQPGPLDNERDARGKLKHRNGSGEDFFFMHRYMLFHARMLEPELTSWQQLPLPAPYLEYDRKGFIRYHENQDGCSVPPPWESPHDAEYTRWLYGVKGNETFFSNYQVWESRYRDPEYLGRMTLAQFGSELELGLHDWLHMRWATITHDPTSDMPVAWNREPSDFSSRWFLPQNDFLGDPFSSHVNPVFWKFHGWIDDRIDDWFRAHEYLHPGEVVQREVHGVSWFEAGPWVEVAEPWLGPAHHSCAPEGMGGGTQPEPDNETMKLALRIALSGDKDVSQLLTRAPRRPWYARSMKNNVT